MVIRTLTDFEELQSVRKYWESWQMHPNTDFEHFRVVCRERLEVKYPFVVVIERDGKPQLFVAGRFEQTHFPISFGYLTLGRIPAKVLSVVYQGVLGELNEEMGEALFRHLWSCVHSKKADAVVIHYLSESSPLLWAVLSHGATAWCEKRPVWSKHRAMDLPEKPGFLLAKMKNRRRIRRREKMLNDRFQGKVHWHWMDRFEDLPGLCAQLEEVAKNTYQRGIGAGFFYNKEHIERFSLFAQRGELRMEILQIHDRIRAFYIGTVYKGVFYAFETGYDPDLREFEVGTLGLIKAADELVREGVRRIDFGFGDAAYKERFGTQCWEEATVRFFRPTAKGFVLRIVLGGSRMIESLAKQLVQRFGGLDRIKTSWRRRLAQRPMRTEKK